MLKKLALIFSFLLALYLIETNPTFGLGNYKPDVKIIPSSDGYLITWQRLLYPAWYEIEASIPSSSEKATSCQQLITYRTWDNKFFLIQNYPLDSYWRVSAHDLFYRPIGTHSDYIYFKQIAKNSELLPEKPKITSVFPSTSPASETPILTWSIFPGAVSYELEILRNPPENPNATTPSQNTKLLSQEVFCNGYNADLSQFKNNPVYWRVRALDYDKNPISSFSDTAQLYINRQLNSPLKPRITSHFNTENRPTPLYPVYSWIPILKAVSYEVELLRQPPENPNGTVPSQFRIWAKQVSWNNCYDDLARKNPGTYYWRVRALDADGRTVGTYSETETFVVNLTAVPVATLGDSITHGGGAISYSAADWDYSFQTYLNFPVLNLGKSGDTSFSMLERFDQDVLPFDPKYLLILCGTNSLRGGTNAQEVIKDLSELRGKCFKNGIRPIFLTLPPINPAAIQRAFQEETTPDWRERFKEVNDFIRTQPYYIDLYPYFVDTNGELPVKYAIDGLHPDIEGKKLIAQIINANWPRMLK